MKDYMEMEASHSAGVIPKREVVIVRGKGARLWDDRGREYIDCVGGHGTANVGHSNPVVAAALEEQARRLLSCPEIFYNDRRAELLTLLAEITPPGLDRAFLCNSGAEAVEAALKFARVATGRTDFVAANRGFHGRTFGALSATWNPKYRKPFEPLVPGFQHVPYGDLGAMETAVGDGTAAVILEVVQGEGGVRPGGGDYLKGVQELCQRKGALFIVDEIQTGMGRTGRMFACEHHDLRPDMLCMAKSMAGGVPMGAVALGEGVGELPPLSHGSTFGGNPLACAAALATIRYVRDERLPERAREMGQHVLERLHSMDLKPIREVRGLGLMIGIEVRKKATPYLKALMEKGVLALPAGPTVIRLLPPLVITRREMDAVLDRLGEVLAG